MKPLSGPQKELLARAAESYASQLEDSAEAKTYLSGRGFGRTTAARFSLGVVTDPFVKEHERFQGRLVIPNFCAAGSGESHVVGLKFRDMAGTSKVKYDQPAGQVARLFNLRALQEAKDVLCVSEGELDAMTIEMLGLSCIGVPGAQSWGGKDSHRNRLLEGIERVILIRDADDPGEDLVKAMSALDNLEVRTPPGGVKDTNELWTTTKNAEAIRRWILDDEWSG